MGNSKSFEGEEPRKIFFSVMRSRRRCLPVSVAPSCCDELDDWCAEATKLSRSMSTAINSSRKCNAISAECADCWHFAPYIQRDLLHERYFDGADEQKPWGNSHEGRITKGSATQPREVSLKHVQPRSESAVVVAEKWNKLDASCEENNRKVKGHSTLGNMEETDEIVVLTLQQFCAVMNLLRKQAFLVNTQNCSSARMGLVNDQECMICMDGAQQIVLPCSHGFCSDCAHAWVELHPNCPLCRTAFHKKSFHKEQWLLETLTDADVMHQVRVLEKKLEAYLAPGCGSLMGDRKQFFGDYVRFVGHSAQWESGEDGYLILSLVPKQKNQDQNHGAA